MYQDEQWLQKKYHQEKLTIHEIADRADCASATVHRWMKEHSIKRRSKGESNRIKSDLPDELYNRERLYELYHEKGMSLADIATHIGSHHATVYNAFVRFDIERRDFCEAVRKGKRDESRLSEEMLVKEYFEKQKSTSEIAADLECSQSTVARWLKRYGYDLRDRQSASEIAVPDGKEHWGWNGGRSRYGEGWSSAKRRKIRERDGFQCRLCGQDNESHKEQYDEQLHVHHIQPARNASGPEVNDPDNLITVCRDCHYVCERMAPLLPDAVNR